MAVARNDRPRGARGAVCPRGAAWQSFRAVREGQSFRAVREGHALIAPAHPFGWIEEPPSINRLLGLAWLSGHEPTALAAMFHAVI